jgi:ribosomal protein L40E
MTPPRAAACPRCSSNRIKRSHSRGIIEKFLKTLNIRAYRCIHCGWRGLRIGKESTQANTAKYGLLQIILIVIVLAVAVIVLLYYLTREETKEEISLGSDKIIVVRMGDPKRGDSSRLIPEN